MTESLETGRPGSGPPVDPIAHAAREAVAHVASELVDAAERVLQEQRRTAAERAHTVVSPDSPTPRHRRATAADDPLNAIVRWCDVEPTGDGPLSGRTVSVKDSIFVAGVPATCGWPALQNHTPTRHATAVERILAAGGRIVATTNMDAFGFAASGETSGYGPTLNPASMKHLAGGSSSGAAAGLSYESIDMSLGSDQGGSVRVPAAWCGALGLKPTHGLVPYTGMAGIDQLIDHAGPIGRSIADLAALLQAIAGPDGSDPRQYAASGIQNGVDYVNAVAQEPTSLRGMRIGIVREAQTLTRELGSTSTLDVLDETCHQFVGLGAEVREVSVAEHLTMGDASFTCNVEGMASLLRAGGQGYGHLGRYDIGFAETLNLALTEAPDSLSWQVQVARMAGDALAMHHRGAAYAAARAALSELVTSYERAFADVDLLVMPTTPHLPHEVSTEPTEAVASLARGWSMLGNTAPFNATGMPALSMPTGTAGGLPVGVMIVGPKGKDAELLRVGAAYEASVGWHLGPTVPTTSNWK